MKNTRMFYGLSDQQINLAKQQLEGGVKSYKRGEIVIKENAIVKEIGIILNGSLCISMFTIDGREILMQKLVPFYLIGAEIACTISQDAPYTMYSTNDTDILWFSVDKIMDKGFLDDDIRLIMLRNIMYLIADENIRKYYKIELITVHSVRERIVRYLTLQRKKAGANKFHIKLNREELANFLAVNRSVLSHELKLMEKEGMIVVKKNYFEITRL
ncbi:Crp/Fnr family transcriptional regulator [Clostridium sp.]|uniref:Crp/Fnr family transcriptional regulator n=1 Tax=Clostridium sp. TaxID=1506 RepID=UPI003D6D43D4